MVEIGYTQWIKINDEVRKEEECDGPRRSIIDTRDGVLYRMKGPSTRRNHNGQKEASRPHTRRDQRRQTSTKTARLKRYWRFW